MASERDLELMDDYLREKLSAEEKASFEQKLKMDASLRREVDLQQQVVNSLKKARMAELKSMMNNIPVPPASVSSALGLKAALYTVLAALTGAGLYLYLNKAEITPPAKDQSTEQVIQPETTKVESVKAEEGVIDSTIAKVEEERKPVASEPKSQTAKPKIDTPAAKKPALDVFAPEDNNESEAKTEKSEGPTISTGEASSKTTLLVDVDKNNKKYQFHYQFKNGRLVLYGPFESNLYEIMEFFSGEKRTAFLFYKNTYYLLDDESGKVNSLKEIKDQKLINKLKEYRAG